MGAIMRLYILIVLCILLIGCSGCDTDDVSSRCLTQSEFETNSNWEQWR